MKNMLLMSKVGMSQLVAGDSVFPVTLLKFLDNKVVDVKTQERDGYSALVFGFGSLSDSEKNALNKPQYGFFKKSGVGFFRKMLEMKGLDSDALGIGTGLELSIFKEGSIVDVVGVSKGKGFAGAMKRHGFGGCRATHGVSLSHRVHGSTGNRTLPGRVFKNKKMAGHMGCDRVTIQNLSVVYVDTDAGVLAVKGAVPGCSGSYVLVKDAVKVC